MRDALKFFAVVASVLVTTASAFAQGDVISGDLIAAAERAYPESKLPVPFGPRSLSAAFAEEADDPSWSSAMEGRGSPA